MDRKSDIGMVGLAVMGSNLALNIERHGYSVSVYNLQAERTRHFIDNPDEGRGRRFTAAFTLRELVDSLAVPRKVMLMIKAGDAVDEVIAHLASLLSPGDLIIDGGNSDYKDTERRCHELGDRGLLFIGCGVSGGGEGALRGPALMPGGMIEGWRLVKNIFRSIAAKGPDGAPCCEWVGPGGAGHFVKMVHNGIEAGDMQLLAEAYHLMKTLYRMSNDAIAETFDRWNGGALRSYLTGIAARVLRFREGDSHDHLIDLILDVAGQKGTTLSAVVSALEQGVPLTVTAEAVAERHLSERKEIRCDMANTFPRESEPVEPTADALYALERALYASKVMVYTQGFDLLKHASDLNRWHLRLDRIAALWEVGCIIRSDFLGKVREAYERNAQLETLPADLFFADALRRTLPSWRQVVALSASHGVAMPAHSAALQFFYALTTETLPANLIQGLRDYFGAYMFERTDALRGEFYHVDWQSGS